MKPGTVPFPPRGARKTHAAAREKQKPTTPYSGNGQSSWLGQRRPSARRVATALRQAGHPVYFTTINRWRSQGWREVKQGEHPIHAARAALDSAVPVLTGDPSTTAEDVVKHSEAKQELEQLSDKQLLSAAARQALVTLTRVEQVFNASARGAEGGKAKGNCCTDQGAGGNHRSCYCRLSRSA